MSVLGVVLAGGESSRMGQDKARLVLGGQTLLERAVAELAPAVDAVVVSVAQSRYGDLGVTELMDKYAGVGPVAGLLTARDYALEHGFTHVFLTSCDLYGLDGGWVAALPEEGHAAFFDGRWQPMVSKWQVEGLVGLEASSTGLWRLLEALGAKKVEPVKGFSASFSINTPEDFERAEAMEKACKPGL